MWSGRNHKQAFREIAQKLDVRYNTVSSQCTRTLGLTTDEFIGQVNSKAIINLLERKYPDQYQKIIAELRSEL
jgi:type III secretory pathway component EscV